MIGEHHVSLKEDMMYVVEPVPDPQKKMNGAGAKPCRERSANSVPFKRPAKRDPYVNRDSCTTGNTEQMVRGIVDGVERVPGVVPKLGQASEAFEEDLDAADAIILQSMPDLGQHDIRNYFNSPSINSAPAYQRRGA